MHLLGLPFTHQGSLLLMSLLAVGVAAQNCQIRVRREFRDLAPTEWQAVVSSIQQTQQSGEYDELVSFHIQNQGTVHNGPNFLPWHRYYILRFEQTLQKHDGSVMLPYWNWAIDSQAPETSILFTDAYLGGNGSGSSQCVGDGQFRDWRPSNPSPHCMTRSWDLGDRISSLYGPEVINRIVSGSMVYETFRTGFEGAPHGAVHNNIGADFATMASPNDPIFWMHHGYVDKVWADWQRQHPDLAQTYGGTNRDGSPARMTDILVTSDFTVASMMSTRDLCYEYAELSELGMSNTAAPPNSVSVVNPGTGADSSTAPNVSGNPPSASSGGVQQNIGRPRRGQNNRPRHQGNLVRRSEYAYNQPQATDDQPLFTGGYSLTPVAAQEEDNDDNDDENDVCSCEPDDEDDEADDNEQPHTIVQPLRNSNYIQRSVSSGDRSDLLAIRTPQPLPEYWIEMQGMDVQAFREHESKLSTVCALVNGLKTYTSPAALVHRSHALEQLAKHQKSFYALVDGKNVTFAGFSSANAIRSAIDIPKAMETQVNNLWQSLESVIGRVVNRQVAAVLPQMSQPIFSTQDRD